MSSANSNYIFFSLDSFYLFFFSVFPVFLLCWLFGLRCFSTGAYRLLVGARSWCQNGGLQGSSYRWIFPGGNHQSLCTHSKPRLPHPHSTSSGDPPRPTGGSGRGSYDVTAFTLGSSTRYCVHARRVESLFHPKPHWPSKPDGLGAPPHGTWPLDWGAWCGTQSFHSCGRTSVIYLFSSLQVAHLGSVGFDYIANAPPSHGFFFVSLDIKYLFFGRFQSFFCGGWWRGSFPDSSVGKECTCNAGDLSLIPGSG